MKIQTTRFGEIELSEDTLLHFPAGMVGLPEVQRFVILDVEQPSVYQWLQSVDEPSLAFIVIDVDLVEPTFQVELPDEAFVEIGYHQGHSLSVMAIVTIPSGKPEEATANLRAPLIINAQTRKGKQMILHETIALRYPLTGSPQSSVETPEVSPEAVSVS